MIIVNKNQPRGLVWIASYPRSGNTWTRTFIHALVNLTLDPAYSEVDLDRIEDMFASESAGKYYAKLLGKPVRRASRAEIAAARPRVQEAIMRSASQPVFVKTHNANALDESVPMINLTVSAGGIYVVRNPLDVAISFAHLRDVPVDQVITDMETSGFGRAGDGNVVHVVTGSWSENVRSWTERPNPVLLVVRYEDMVEKPEQAFGSIARHLLMQPSDEQLRRAIDLSGFERLQAKEVAGGFKEKPETSKLPFFREGRVGQWRDALTEKQVERVIAAHGPVMRRFGYLPPN